MIKELFSLTRYQLLNVTRGKWLLIYSLFFFGFTSALLMFDSDSSKVTASILSVVLLIVPMISIIYSSIYWYNSEAFTSLLLTQPIRRSNVYLSSWLSVSLALTASLAVSAGSALLFYGSFESGPFAVLLFGCLLNFIFVGIGLLIATIISDRMKGVGTSLLVWFYFSVFHDVLVFAMASFFKDYPIETPTMILVASNPIDLARIDILLMLDFSAMMGYTGKILQNILSGWLGIVLTTGILVLWILVPIVIGVQKFSKKDL